MELENQIPEEEVSILTLTDENGQDADFEYLDCIEYQGKEYLVLMPADEMATEIVILEVEPVDEENENYLSVSDEKILNGVYAIFKEKYKDILTVFIGEGENADFLFGQQVFVFHGAPPKNIWILP